MAKKAPHITQANHVQTAQLLFFAAFQKLIDAEGFSTSALLTLHAEGQESISCKMAFDDYGYEPTALNEFIDALAVAVHGRNTSTTLLADDLDGNGFAWNLDGKGWVVPSTEPHDYGLYSKHRKGMCLCLHVPTAKRMTQILEFIKDVDDDHLVGLQKFYGGRLTPVSKAYFTWAVADGLVYFFHHGDDATTAAVAPATGTVTAAMTLGPGRTQDVLSRTPINEAMYTDTVLYRGEYPIRYIRLEKHLIWVSTPGGGNDTFIHDPDLRRKNFNATCANHMATFARLLK